MIQEVSVEAPPGRVGQEVLGGADHRSGLTALGVPHLAPDLDAHHHTSMIPLLPTPTPLSPLVLAGTDTVTQFAPSRPALSSAPHIYQTVPAYSPFPTPNLSS